MGWYLYAVGPPGLAAGSAPGVDGSPVRVLRSGPLRALVSELPVRPSPSLDRVRAHDRVVRDAAGGDATPLPARFGQWFATGEALVNRLLEDRERYRTRLEAVRGAVEFAIAVRAASGTSGPAAREPSSNGSGRRDGGPDRAEREPGAGRAYLESLARRERAEREALEWGRHLAEELRERVGPLVRDERVDVPDAGARTATIAHLVKRPDAEAYAASARAWRAGRSELRIVIDGPSPPYSFAG